MSALTDALAEFGSLDGFTFPEGMFDALISAHQTDLADADSISGAKIAELTEGMSTSEGTINSLKVRIHDLMASAPIEDEARETFDDPDAPADEDDTTGADVDDLFADTPDDDNDK